MSTDYPTGIDSSSEGINEQEVKRDLSRLKWLVHRYELVVEVFAHSLTDEFFPTHDAVEDWTNNISLLREAAFPIGDLLKKTGYPSECFHEQHFAKVNGFINKAIAVLVEHERAVDSGQPTSSVASVLIAANVELRRAALVLSNWLSDMEGIAEEQPEDESSPRQQVASKLLVGQSKRFGRLASQGIRSDEGRVNQQCMSSRKIYLLANYIAMRFRSVWTQEQFVDLVTTHDKLISVMIEGSPYRQSVIQRRDQIVTSEHLNPWQMSIDDIKRFANEPVE